MRDTEVIADWVGDLARSIREEIASLDAAALAWQADAEANSIGVTVWHIARWVDILGTRVLVGNRAEDEQWHTQGWTARTGYDPRGIGANGLGAITGYTQDEVRAIPALTADEHLAYLDQVCERLRDGLLALPKGALYQPAPGSRSSRPMYQTLKNILQGCFGHVGEIEALKGLRARTQADTPVPA